MVLPNLWCAAAGADTTTMDVSAGPRWSLDSFRAATEAIGMLDVEGVILDANSAFECLTGADSGQLRGRRVDELWVIESALGSQTLVERLRSDGALTIEVDPRVDDSVPQACLRFVLVKSRSGVPQIGVQATSADLVHRNRSVSMDSRGFQLSFDQIDVGMFITGLDGFIAQINEALCRLLGRSREEMAEVDVFATVHPDDRQADLELGLAAYTGESDGWTREKRLIHRDGSIVWVLETATLIRDDEGKPLHFLSQFVDITARRAAEEERDRAEEALRQSEAKLKFLADGMPVGLVEVGAQGEIRSVNPALADLLGRDPIGHLALDLMHPADRERVTVAFEKASADGEDWSIDFRVVRPDGSTRWVRAHTRLHIDPNGELTTATSTWTDVSDELEAKRASERSTELLRVQATTDSLTGVSNRVALQDRLSKALARCADMPHEVAVLFIDLDHFKLVNDRWGHDIGDELLVEAARRLRRCVRDGDTVGRFGGDEFVVIADAIAGTNDAVRLGERIVTLLGRPFECRSGTVEMSASVGLAISDRSASARSLLRDADRAVYRAKAEGRSCLIAA